VPLVWVVRTRADPHALSAPIQMALRDATGGLPVARIRSMDEVVVQSTARADFNMLLLTVFGFAALLLAAIGVYGLMSYSVEQRTQEIGIRLALGAGLNQVRNMVIVQGMGLAAAGVAIGTASVFGLARLVESLLFGVTARDPIVFVAVPAALSAVASLAVWLPALRATRIRIWNEEFGIWNSRRIPNSKFQIPNSSAVVPVASAASQRLHFAPLPLRFQPLLLRGPLWLRRPARPGPPGGVLQQSDEPRTCGLAVLPLRAMLAAVDEEHAVGRHAIAGEPDEPISDVDGQ